MAHFSSLLPRIHSGCALLSDPPVSDFGNGPLKHAHCRALILGLELLTKPPSPLIQRSCQRKVESSATRCSPSVRMRVHERSLTSRCVVGSDPTVAAVLTTSAQGWQTPLTRPCLYNWHSVRPAQRNSLGDAAAGTRLRFWHDLLAAVT